MKRLDRENLARYLDSLITSDPVLNTNVKVARRAGVSTNTVRRVRLGEETDVALFNVEAIAHAFKQPLSVFIASAEADAPDVVLVPENALPVSLPTPVYLILAKIAALPEARILALGVALGVYGLRKPIDPSFAGVRENGQQ